MSERQIATVRYQVADYRGEVTVNCEPNDDDHEVIMQARRRLANQVPFPMGYESWDVVSRENI